MRGQRPALSSLLAWIVVLVVLMGSLAVLAPAAGAGTGTALPQLPLEERGGGEGSQHELAPAKLRRAVLQAGQADDAPCPATAAYAMATTWKRLIRQRPASHLLPDGWADASPRPPRDDAPGRRLQRGQAPPLA